MGDLTHIEFVGGPFDGEFHPFPYPPQVEMLGLPVNSSGVLPFKDEPPPPGTPATSFAFYELRQKGGDWQYVFVEARPGDQFKLDRNAPVIQAALEAGRRAVEKFEMDRNE